jgi:HAD superfamily hydrolase (TIGR01509 family)
MVSAAIFDIDGTLVSFEFDVQGTRAVLLEEMRRSGFDSVGLGMTSPTQAILDAAKIQALGRKDLDYGTFRKKAYSILDAFELESAPTTSAFPGTRKELDYLRSRGIRLAVLTNSGRVAADEVLRRAKLTDCFEFILTRDEIEAMKPKSDGILQALSRLRLPSESVCYVGDSPYDIMAAKGAGIKVVSVATGNYSKDRLESEGADYVITSITELRGVLGV